MRNAGRFYSKIPSIKYWFGSNPTFPLYHLQSLPCTSTYHRSNYRRACTGLRAAWPGEYSIEQVTTNEARSGVFVSVYNRNHLYPDTDMGTLPRRHCTARKLPLRDFCTSRTVSISSGFRPLASSFLLYSLSYITRIYGRTLVSSSHSAQALFQDGASGLTSVNMHCRPRNLH
jgi:hypothetical protein